MLIFLVKSTVCLVVFYGFYHFILSNQKILLFNRIYLISSLIFSLIIPFVKIPVESVYTLNTTIRKIPIIQNSLLQNDQIISNSSLQQLPQNIFMIFLCIVSSLLFLRFLLNLMKIIRKIYWSERIIKAKVTMVLVNEKILPYSFFNFIFLNKSDFENGKIENDLIKHEETHCMQYHSVDIILLELINIVLWFNPLIWFYRSAIRLNHEYYADSRVLSQTDPIIYYNILVDLLIQNSSNSLVSNFKNSLIKNRLIMMTNDNPLQHMILKKSFAIALFLVIGSIVTFSQRTITPDNSKIIMPSQQQIKPENSSFENSKKPRIEEASITTILEKIAIFQGNVKFRIPDTDSSYTIIKTDSATIDTEKNIYSSHSGIMEKFNSGQTNPFKTISFEDLRYDFNSGKTYIKKIKAVK